MHLNPYLIPRFITQAEGGGVSAELEFIEQQNMILTMENRALRQRLESISQEQMIKQCQHLYCLLPHIAFLHKQTEVQIVCRGARNVGERNREIAISVSYVLNHDGNEEGREKQSWKNLSEN